MKYLSLIVLFIFTFSFLNGQVVTKQSKEFLSAFYKDENNPGKVFLYSKGINPHDRKEMIEDLQRHDTLKQWRRIDNKLQVTDTIILTAKEKQFIISELEKQVDTVLWNETGIPNASAISLDSVMPQKRNRNYSYLYSGKTINSFTIPILFRNGQLCVFYCAQHCGTLCGGGEFAIYKREKDHWVKWFTIYEWVS